MIRLDSKVDRQNGAYWAKEIAGEDEALSSTWKHSMLQLRNWIKHRRKAKTLKYIYTQVIAEDLGQWT